MCIVFFTAVQPGYKLILAANRDEFYDRPATPAAWHDFSDGGGGSGSNSVGGNVVSGRDVALGGGGTWLGMTRDLRIGVLTNIRDPSSSPTSVKSPSAPSRGQLLRRYLASPGSASISGPSSVSPVKSFLSCESGLEAYEGFNLLLFSPTSEGDGLQIGHMSNRPAATATLLDGQAGAIHGVSNTPIAHPWPKVVEGQKRMEMELRQWEEESGTEDALIGRLFGLLRQSIPVHSPADAPRCTCIPPIQINGRWYGTRVSTIVLVSNENEVTFVERDIGGIRDGVGMFVEGQTADRVFRFRAGPTSAS